MPNTIYGMPKQSQSSTRATSGMPNTIYGMPQTYQDKDGATWRKTILVPYTSPNVNLINKDDVKLRQRAMRSPVGPHIKWQQCVQQLSKRPPIITNNMSIGIYAQGAPGMYADRISQIQGTHTEDKIIKGFCPVMVHGSSIRIYASHIYAELSNDPYMIATDMPPLTIMPGQFVQMPMFYPNGFMIKAQGPYTLSMIHEGTVHKFLATDRPDVLYSGYPVPQYPYQISTIKLHNNHGNDMMKGIMNDCWMSGNMMTAANQHGENILFDKPPNGHTPLMSRI